MAKLNKIWDDDFFKAYKTKLYIENNLCVWMKPLGIFPHITFNFNRTIRRPNVM